MTVTHRLTFSDAVEQYVTWLRRTGIAQSSKDTYERHVRAFATWVGDQGTQYDDALSDEYVRDYVARDYRRSLLEQRRAPSTVGLAMAAVGSFFDSPVVGMGKPDVPSTDIPKRGPRALTGNEVRAMLRAAERRGPRDYCLVATLYLAGARVSEVAGLDVDDVYVTERTGQVSLLGKGDQPRKVPLSVHGRKAHKLWLADRPSWPGADSPALFLSRRGRRLSVRSIQHIVSQIAAAAGVEASPHTLRHTMGRRFVEQGGDLVALQELLGHQSVQTTAGYARPSAEFLAEAVESLDVEL